MGVYFACSFGMFYHNTSFKKIRRAVGWLAILGALAAPAFAHTTKVAGNVAVTIHVEPDHNPAAGQPSRVWFALTQRGGRLIPLSQCDCRLRVFSQVQTSGSQPMMQPALNPISAERYRDIPGTDLTFPQVGIYTLELQGSPKAGATFNRFTVSYPVTVRR